MKRLFLAYLLIFFILPGSIFSAEVASGEIHGKTPDQVDQIVRDTLEKIGSGYTKQEKTHGFNYRYTNPFFNLYNFNIYIGEYEKDNTILRIESIDNTSNALLDAITTSATGVKYAYTYKKKNLIVAHALTLVLPAAGNIYTNWDSLLSTKWNWLFSVLYLAIDGGLLWMGGTDFFTHDFDPFGKGLTSTLLLMGSYRVGHMVFNHISIVAHNNLVGLGYTFHYK